VDLSELSARILFTDGELAEMGVARQDLAAFTLTSLQRRRLTRETLGDTTLERRPLLAVDGDVALACPAATSAAVRSLIIREISAKRHLHTLARLIRIRQRQTVFYDSLPQLAYRGGDALPPQTIPPGPPGVNADMTVVPLDRDKLAHVVVVHDDLDEVRRLGLASHSEPDPDGKLSSYLASAAQELNALKAGGLTLVVFAGVGRSAAFAFQEMPEGWHASAVSVGDLETLAWTHDASLLRIWKLLDDVEHLANSGIQIPMMYGLLNTYAYWQQQDYQLAPPEFGYPDRGMIVIGAEFVRDIRCASRVRNDVHAAPVDRSGAMLTVRRLLLAGYFEELERRPVFAAMDPLRESNELVGVVDAAPTVLWVRASRPDVSVEAVGFIYHIWEGLLQWLDRVAGVLQHHIEVAWAPPVTVRLELPNVERWEEFSTSAGEVATEELTMEVLQQEDSLVVGIPFGFLSYFRQPTNDAERMLVELACEGILQVLQSHLKEVDTISAAETAAICLGGPDARTVHLFGSLHVPDLVARDPRSDLPRLLQPEDRSSWQRGLAWRVLASRTQIIQGAVNCTETFRVMVDSIWEDLKGHLAQLNRRMVVEIALENVEAILGHREWWRRTMRALYAIYQDDARVTEVAAAREAERGPASHAGRTLIEMAISTCPHDGRRPAWSDLDRLLAGVNVLVEVATDSDAIHRGVADPTVNIAKNGAIMTDRSFVAEVANPFVIESFASGLQAAVDDYELLYRKEPSGGEMPADTRRPEFVEAFTSEYGFTPNLLIEAVAELFDLALESQKRVVKTTRGMIKSRLCNARNFTDVQADGFLEMLTLVPRDDWAQTPAGYEQRDWQPWRYRRRLSVIMRPLLQLSSDDDAEILFGVSQLGASISYILELLRFGWLPNEAFHSLQMRQHRGRLADRGMSRMNSGSLAGPPGARWECDHWERPSDSEMSTLSRGGRSSPT
jgi:hypothetical protein